MYICAELAERAYISFEAFNYLVKWYYNFKSKSNRYLRYYLLIEYRIKIRPQRLIHDVYKPALVLSFWFLWVNLINLCAYILLIIRIKVPLELIYTKCVLTSDITRTFHVKKNHVSKATSLRMARISLIEEKLN